MKKEGVFSLLAILILLISISLVSASLLGDVWNKITGRPIDENVTDDDTSSETIEEIEEEVTPEPEPEPEICGDNICQEDEKCDRDCCENICALECPLGAVEGSCGCECIVKPEPPEPPSDDKECQEGEMRYYECPDGTKVPNCECESNMWVCKIFKDENCPDVGHEPETCAFKIQITFNKGSYQLGDDVKIIIEVFDSQGNHLPNYAFYGQMYDDRWHTPDIQKTDSKGYFISTTIAEKPAGGVTEVKFKVYTKEIGSCGSVEDTAEVKLEPGDCGIGGCAPEPGCKDKIRMCGGKCDPCPEDDGDGEIFYPCSGCELEDKCYPYGYRKAGNYCSDEDDLFVAQSGDDEKCENNFECKTNLCINGNCVSSNVWNKFLEWFGKIFGGGEGPGPGLETCSKLLIEKDIGEWEYFDSIYGSTKESQAPVYSKDGTYKDTLKCCMAGYKNKETDEEKAALVCPYKNRQDLENSFYWILVHEQTRGLKNLVLTEYKDQRVYGSDDDIAILWAHNSYFVGSGGEPRVGTPFSEEISDAYLKKYPSDLDLTEDDIPYIPPNPLPDEKGKSFVFCTEEDKELAKECGHSGGAPQSDPSTLERTGQSKIACIESGGHAEGCCEVYTGCIMPDENCEDIEIVSTDSCYWHVARLNQNADLCEKITDGFYKSRCLRDTISSAQNSGECEKIDDTEHRNKCYINVAEHTGDSNICKKIDDKSLQEKCYFWIAEQTESDDVCIEIEDIDLQKMCYVNLAEKTGNANICEKITDSHIRDKCYRDVGIQTNNKALCEKIIEEQAKQKCLDNTS